MAKKFIVTLTGAVDVEAENYVEATQKARELVGPWPILIAKEVGVDVDENGWSLKN